MQNIFRFLLVGLIFAALNVGTVAAEERCAGAPTDEDRANCMAATRLSDADMSTPEGRCAGAPTDKDRENCIAANKGMGGYRSDGPPGTPVADMSTPEERCAGAPTDEDRANCIAANKRMGKRMGDADMSTPEGRCAGAPTDEERANCMAANKRMGDHRRDGPPGEHHANGTPGMSAGEALQIENAKASMDAHNDVVNPLNARIALLENQAGERDAEIAGMQESASTMVASIAQFVQQVALLEGEVRIARDQSTVFQTERDVAMADGAQKLIEVAQLTAEVEEARSIGVDLTAKIENLTAQVAALSTRVEQRESQLEKLETSVDDRLLYIWCSFSSKNLVAKAACESRSGQYGNFKEGGYGIGK